MADLEVTRDGAVATLTMNRPEARNALSAEMVELLSRHLHAVETDPTVRAVVLRGANGHFMAGGDVKSFTRLTDPGVDARAEMLHHIHRLHTVMFAMRRMPKPVVAVVEGAAAGAGVSMAAACDLVIAAESAFFTLAYVNIGTSPDGSSTWFLPRKVGLGKALELAMLGDRHSAEEMRAAGLVNWVVADHELDTRAGELVRRLASGPTHALGRTKTLLHRSSETQFEAQLQAEAEGFASCATTDDFAEGVRAFVEKRRPQFSGS